jgi:hypothetical protein
MPPPPTPIYERVCIERGWSPDWLSPPFDLTEFLLDAKAKATAHRVLIAARDAQGG